TLRSRVRPPGPVTVTSRSRTCPHAWAHVRLRPVTHRMLVQIRLLTARSPSGPSLEERPPSASPRVVPRVGGHGLSRLRAFYEGQSALLTSLLSTNSARFVASSRPDCTGRVVVDVGRRREHAPRTKSAPRSISSVHCRIVPGDRPFLTMSPTR